MPQLLEVGRLPGLPGNYLRLFSCPVESSFLAENPRYFINSS